MMASPCETCDKPEELKCGGIKCPRFHRWFKTRWSEIQAEACMDNEEVVETLKAMKNDCDRCDFSLKMYCDPEHKRRCIKQNRAINKALEALSTLEELR